MSARVAVLDYGSGNLTSAERALRRVGADVTITAEPGPAAAADGLVVPGVGAFAACLAQLAAVRGDAVIRDRLAGERPVLGICVGMQVLFDSSDEQGGPGQLATGLGALPGHVRRLRAPVLPHMGWNQVTPVAGSTLFAGIDSDTRFYFVHSYAVTASQGAVSTAWHGERFVAAVEAGPISATQFHPEKSGDAGAALLANWVASL